MTIHRIYYFLVIFVFTFILSTCGSSSDGPSSDVGSSSDDDSGTYLMGGSIQGEPLSLTAAVTTLAGSAGSSGTSDGTGATARFYIPEGITTDGADLYVTDTANHSIRQIVIVTGEVSTLAGNAGTSGYIDGDGAAALFNTPLGITTDGDNLYVVETGNHTIRQIVIATGEVSTLAGNAGTSGYNDGTGTTALFYNPFGITTDGTNLYVAETVNHTIRKIVIATGEVTTLAGSTGTSGSNDGIGTAALFNVPTHITTDGTNLFVTDTSNHTIRKVVIVTGEVSTLAGNAGLQGSTDGTGVAALFSFPYGITTDGTNLYVSDTNNSTIRKVVIVTGEVSTLAGTAGISGSVDGTGANAQFIGPQGITTDAVNLYVTDAVTIRQIE